MGHSMSFGMEISPALQNESELRVSGQIIQFGRPPNRIDLLNTIDGVEFEDVWETKETVTLVFPENEFPLYLIGLDKLIENKAASCRGSQHVAFALSSVFKAC